MVHRIGIGCSSSSIVLTPIPPLLFPYRLLISPAPPWLPSRREYTAGTSGEGSHPFVGGCWIRHSHASHPIHAIPLQVAHLHPLLSFLHEPVYGQQSSRWERAVIRPFEGAREEGVVRLREVLSRCVFLAQKKDIRAIPLCTKKVRLE